MPYSQLPDMMSHLAAAGATDYQGISLPGNGHAFAFWDAVKDHALDFLAAAFSGAPLPAPSPTATPGPLAAKQLLNVSTRAQVTTGEGVMIGGFIVTGANPKQVVVRGLGPSLSQDGLGGTLADPLLQLFDPTTCSSRAMTTGTSTASLPT